MKTILMAALIAVGTIGISAGPVQAKPYHHHHSARTHAGKAVHSFSRHARYRASHHRRKHALRASYGDPRPGAWCGWYARQVYGVADRSYNLARRWASYGSRATGPAVGVIVVWSHHVGWITGGSAGNWVVKSGNDGHTVRERVRSLRGVIAYRIPSGQYAQAN